jgi:hypothetical protein
VLHGPGRGQLPHPRLLSPGSGRLSEPAQISHPKNQKYQGLSPIAIAETGITEIHVGPASQPARLRVSQDGPAWIAAELLYQ